MHARESPFVVRRPASERMLAVFVGIYLTTTDSEMQRSGIKLGMAGIGMKVFDFGIKGNDRVLST